MSVAITNETQQLSAGHMYRIHCQAVGSVPPAKIFWWKDDQPLNQLSGTMTSIYVSKRTTADFRDDLVFIPSVTHDFRCSAKESTNKNVSSSVLTFVPTKRDCNATIRCIASNPNVKTWRKETSWTLDVTCKRILHIIIWL